MNNDNFGNFGAFKQPQTTKTANAQQQQHQHQQEEQEHQIRGSGPVNTNLKPDGGNSNVISSNLVDPVIVASSVPPSILPPGLQTSQNQTQAQHIPAQQQIQQQQSQQLYDSPAVPAQVQQQLSDVERFGLKGLFNILLYSETGKIAIGQDLSMITNNLNSKSIGCINSCRSLQSPWLETSIKDVEPQYTLPRSVMKMNKVKFSDNKNGLKLTPPENRVGNYLEDTLFFIFYSKPVDLMQELAARELRERNWRYHKVLKVWLTKLEDSKPIQESSTSERGVYIFFDPQLWQKVKKDFVLEYNAIL